MKRTARTTAAVLCGCMLALGCGSDAGGSSSEEEVTADSVEIEFEAL